MTNSIEKSIEIAAPIERVWRAISDHEEFGAWFGVRIDGPFVSGEAASGHMTISGYTHLKWEVWIEKIEKPHLFSFRWHPYAVDPEIDYSAEPPTLVEFRLQANGNGTRVTVTETGFDDLPAHRLPDALRMNTDGWQAQMQNIKAHVES